MASKKNVAIEVGKAINLKITGMGIRLGKLPGDDGKPGSAGYQSNTAGYLVDEEARVLVESISTHQLGHSVWLKVKSARNPAKRGWVRLMLEVPKGHRVSIGRLDFMAPEEKEGT